MRGSVKVAHQSHKLIDRCNSGDRNQSTEVYYMTNQTESFDQMFNIIETQVGAWKLIDYAIQHGRLCPELEQLIIDSSPQCLYHYAKGVIECRWPEVESSILPDVNVAYLYALNVIKGRWPEAEQYIKNNMHLSMNYAIYVMKERWIEIEPAILTNLSDAIFYANSLIEGRWIELEEKIKESPLNIVSYVLQVKKERWPEVESVIMTDPYCIYQYAKFVFKGRWPEAEEVILNSDWKDTYLSMCENNERKKKNQPRVK